MKLISKTVIAVLVCLSSISYVAAKEPINTFPVGKELSEKEVKQFQQHLKSKAYIPIQIPGEDDVKLVPLSAINNYGSIRMTSIPGVIQNSYVSRISNLESEVLKLKNLVIDQTKIIGILNSKVKKLEEMNVK